MVGMGFDGAAPFSGKHTGVQARLKQHAPHAVYVHCHGHQLQLACIQAANATKGIDHVYTTLMTLWKFFHYSPKCAQSLKEVQKVLNLPELKIVKPSDTRWLSHERCVKAVKMSYSAIVLALDGIYNENHRPEALGLSKILSKPSTLYAIFLLDEILPQTAKLSKALQAVHIDLSAISALVDNTLHMIDAAMEPAANWILQLVEIREELDTTIGLTISVPDIVAFTESTGKSFVSKLKANISSRFGSQDVIAAFSVFDPSKVPSIDSPGIKLYGESSINTLHSHFGISRAAKTLDGVDCMKEPIVSDETIIEWKNYRRFIAQHPKECIGTQLQELVTNDMMGAMYPNLKSLATVCLTMPVTLRGVFLK